jgi:DNA-binding HxlR family transcriptional regulator
MVKPCKLKELKGHIYHCYFELTLQVLGGKWKPILLYHLSRQPIMRFSELRRNIPRITERMLSKQLRELETDGLVLRTVYREVPPRVEYSLTALGISLIPILLQLREWGVKYEAYLGGDGKFTSDGYELPDPVKVADCYSEPAQKTKKPRRVAI